MTWNVEIPSRKDAISQQRAHGGWVAAVFPVHYPRALFSALNALPVEVWGPRRAGDRSDAHLPSYTCDIVKKGLSFIIDGGLDGVDLIVVPHGCDSLQGLASILKDFIPNTKPVLPLYVPRLGDTSGAEYFAREIKSLGDSAARILAATIDEGKLRSALEEEARAVSLIKELWRNRRSVPATNRELFNLLRSREYLPAERFSSLVSLAIEGRREQISGGVPLLLSGVVPEPMEFLDLLDRLGAAVVADDFISGGRRLYGESPNPDPWLCMAESILAGPGDSTRGSSFEERGEHLVRLAKTSGARGAIFLGVKFCEPEQFYLPAMAKRLKLEGIPSLVLETGLDEALAGNTVTRVEAFMETLS